MRYHNQTEFGADGLPVREICAMFVLAHPCNEDFSLGRPLLGEDPKELDAVYKSTYLEIVNVTRYNDFRKIRFLVFCLGSRPACLDNLAPSQ